MGAVLRLGLEGREERQVPALLAVFCHPAADQLQGWPQLSLGKLIHQLMEFLAHRAHGRTTSLCSVTTGSRLL